MVTPETAEDFGAKEAGERSLQQFLMRHPAVPLL